MSNALGYSWQGDTSQPCILFLHGFMGSRADWEPVCAGLVRQYRCLAVDLPGHGQSRNLAGGDSYTMAGAVRAIEALLDRLSIARCAVVGYSMGGRLALMFALAAPERCRRLVVESATPGLRREADRAARRGLDEERAAQLESGDFTTFLARWYEQPLFETLARHEGLVARMMHSRRDNDPKELARALRGFSVGRQPSLWERLEQLQVSTMVVAGALDGKYTEIAENMAVRTNRVRTAILSNVGHNVHAENPTAYVDLLKDFLNHP